MFLASVGKQSRNDERKRAEDYPSPWFPELSQHFLEVPPACRDGRQASGEKRQDADQDHDLFEHHPNYFIENIRLPATGISAVRISPFAESVM